MRLSTDADINALANELLREGWVVAARKTHTKLRHPSGRILVVNRTPSDCRAFLNFKADVRRARAAVKESHVEVQA